LSVQITRVSVGAGGQVTAYWSMTFNRMDMIVNFLFE
jgi:hypothetical protein